MSDIHRRLPRQLVRSDSEKGVRGMLNFRSRKLEFSESERVVRKGGVGSRKRENETPVEAYVSPRKKAPAQLPEKYALLESFYEGVEAAISLLGIRRQLCTFPAVCSTVEATTKRRFLQKHLAQIKYILPEAIDLEYVRSYDQDTRSKNWEMKISLLPMPAEAEEPTEAGCSRKKPKIETVQRRRAFHARLVKFVSTHPEHDDVPEHPLPERTFLGNSASKGTLSGMPAVTTCIPMEINTAVHRVEVPESDSLASVSTHFSRSFKSSFSSMAEKPASSIGSLLSNDKTGEDSSIDSGIMDTILPMPINRTPHRDIHTLAKMPLGTPHLAPSFSPFFSVKRSLSEPELDSETGDVVTQSTIVDNMPSSSVQLTPMKRRHAGPEEEPEIVAPVELQTPIKIVRTCETPKRRASEMESPSKRPHFSPAFKPHFSVSGSPLSHSRSASRSLLSTPVKPSVSKEVPISWDVRTPGRTSNDALDRCSPIEEECAGLRTPVKSSIPAHSFKSPAPTSKHLFTPCTPRTSHGEESPVDVSYHAGEPRSVCQEGFRSPAATPVKPVSSSRSLNFASPKSASKDSGVPGTPCPCSPGMDVPSTPGMRTPVNPSRSSRFRNKVAMKHSKLNLGPLFARTDSDGSSGDEAHQEGAGCREGADSVSNSCITERSSAFVGSSSASGTPSLRKSLSFASEVSQADMSMLQGLPAELLQSVMKEEMKVAEEKSKDVAGIRHRQQMMAGLPHLFNQLRLIFQSSNKSVFPYRELLSKVVSSNTEITDKSEVEERLKMLMEMAPEWISAKKSLSGDMLYRIDKKADVMRIRKKLCEAV
ncbi:hypothetical protein M758_8G079000 [Ceratodon purpureus]|nr:hypothetical protein M758_8G079000 [Ceratodon purpureus]